MTEKEIIKYIDAGANFYVSMFGRAEHMEVVDNGFYTYVKPKAGEYGITSVSYTHLGNSLPVPSVLVPGSGKNG